MTLDQFIILQEELWFAFGWFVRWWLILFIAAGVALAGFVFFLTIARSWLDAKF